MRIHRARARARAILSPSAHGIRFIFLLFKPIPIRAHGSRFRRGIDIDLHARGFDRLRALPNGAAGGRRVEGGGRERLAFPV
jgi:hypothetical protein